MYNLQAVFAECKLNLENMGIPISNRVTVSINYRAHKRYGQCKKLPNSTYSININADLLKEVNPIAALQSTVYHELIHTCPKCMNHGSEWKRYAEQVNKATGLNIKRTSSSEEKGLVEFKGNKKKIKYVVACPSCGKKWEYQRAGKKIQNLEKYRCGYCGGKLMIE